MQPRFPPASTAQRRITSRGAAFQHPSKREPWIWRPCGDSPGRRWISGDGVPLVRRPWLGMRQTRSCRQGLLPPCRCGSSVRAGSCTGPLRSSSGVSQKNKKGFLRPNTPRSRPRGRLTRTTVSVSYPCFLSKTLLWWISAFRLEILSTGQALIKVSGTIGRYSNGYR
jgi:hypothetical protein